MASYNLYSAYFHWQTKHNKTVIFHELVKALPITGKDAGLSPTGSAFMSRI